MVASGQGAGVDQLNYPTDIRVDGKHTLYVSDDERHRKMNEKIIAALIKILVFISTFRPVLQSFSRNYTAQVNKKKRGEEFSHDKLQPQPQTGNVTTRGRKSRERAIRRETSSSMDREIERKGKQVHVEAHTRKKLKFAVPG